MAFISNSDTGKENLNFHKINNQHNEVIGSCCLKTIDIHSNNNRMMVCPECKQIIKCFREEKDFRNYLIFCHSRRRNVKTTIYDNQYVVVFNSYNTYGNY